MTYLIQWWLYLPRCHIKSLIFLFDLFLSLLHLNNNTFFLNQKVSSAIDPSLSVPINLVQAITASYLNYCFSFLSDLTAHCLASCNIIPPKCESAHSYLPIQQSFVIPLLLEWNSKFLSSLKKPYVNFLIFISLVLFLSTSLLENFVIETEL